MAVRTKRSKRVQSKVRSKKIRRTSMKKRGKRSSTKRSKKTKRSKRMRGGAGLTTEAKMKLDSLFIFEGTGAQQIKQGLQWAVGQIRQDYLPWREIELYNEVVDYTTENFKKHGGVPARDRRSGETIDAPGVSERVTAAAAALGWGGHVQGVTGLAKIQIPEDMA
jgi:hypothetical protein